MSSGNMIPSFSTLFRSTSDATSSDQPQTFSSSGSSSTSGRKRRAPDSVTLNACTNCKKSRVKCDGVKPVCGKCRSRRVQDTCHYEVHVKTAKEQMIREIQRLRQEKEHLEERHDTLEEKHDWDEQIIRALKDDGQGDEIILRLKRGETYQSIALWLSSLSSTDIRLSPTSSHHLTQVVAEYHRNAVKGADHPRHWTSVTSDTVLIEHLIMLYFTWIHPAHVLLEESYFLASYRSCSDTYCSKPLVNVICAMSCHLLHGSWKGGAMTEVDIDVLQEQFMDEARAGVSMTNYSKMSTIQTYAIMFLTELASGHGLIATSHLRLATESWVSKQGEDQSRESEDIASWGILTLHTAWSAHIYQKPSAPTSTHATVFDDVSFDKHDTDWRHYREPEDYAELSRPSYVILVASEQAKLYRIVHESIAVYCGGLGRITAQAILRLYERYLRWREELPRDIDNISDESQALPHSLSLQVQYHTALVQLFHPVLHLDGLDEATQTFFRETTAWHARSGLAMLEQYRIRFSCCYQATLQVFCLLHLSDSLMRYGPPDQPASDIVRFCFEYLEESKSGFRICGPLQKMFHLAVLDYGMPIPEDLEPIISSISQYGPEELLDACTRSSYTQPTSQILPNMDDDIAQDFPVVWHDLFEESFRKDRYTEENGNLNSRSMQINSILNL